MCTGCRQFPRFKHLPFPYRFSLLRHLTSLFAPFCTFLPRIAPVLAVRVQVRAFPGALLYRFFTLFVLPTPQVTIYHFLSVTGGGFRGARKCQVGFKNPRCRPLPRPDPARTFRPLHTHSPVHDSSQALRNGQPRHGNLERPISKRLLLEFRDEPLFIVVQTLPPSGHSSGP